MYIKKVSEMNLDEKLGQLILAGFHSTEFDDDLKDIIENHHIGNIIMFTRNYTSAAQMRKLTKKIHEECIKNNGIIPFIAIDQEGGLVTRMMTDVTFAPGPMTCTASSKDASFKAGKMLAEDMIKLGMNLNLAPSLDVNNNPDNPVINVRSYSDDPKVVSEMGANFIKGSMTYGVLPCAKHFPGHGDCAVDSHLGLPIINYDSKRIHEVEMYPFIQNIDVPAIMSAHILFPLYDNVPATLSRKIITGVLREELNYKGLTISDCLEMKAIADNFGTPEGAVRAIKAGIDLVCISHTKEYQLKTLELLKQEIVAGNISIEEIDEHVERILKFKEKTLSYLEKYFYNQEEVSFSKENKQEALNIVESSLTHCFGKLPVLAKDTIVIAPAAKARTIIEDEFDERNLASVLKKEFSDNKIVELIQTEEEKNKLLETIKNYQKVIFFSYNAAINPWQVNLINEIISKKETFVISLKGPMDYHKYHNLENYMCMYEYTPNSITTIVDYFKGKLTPKGKLPIKL